MNAWVRCPACSNCSQNCRIALVASDGSSPSNRRLAFLELADCARGRVEAQRQFVAVLAQPRQDEREAAQIGRYVDVGLARLAVLVEEGVGALMQAHQRDRDRLSPAEKTIG